MDTAVRMIEVKQQGNTLVLMPGRDLRELEHQEIDAAADELLQRLESQPAIRNVVVEFCQTDYFGSTALRLLTRLWQLVQRRHGRMAFCNLSAHEGEILRVSGLATLWSVHSSRQDALEAVGH
jgi:anti-anti-sigma factor